MTIHSSTPVAEPLLAGTFRTSFPIVSTEIDSPENRAAGKIIIDRQRMLGLARAKAPDPSLFDQEGRAPYFWTAQASNNLVDFYYTRMARSSLRNYAADATESRAFLLGHRSNEMPIGRTIEGRFTDAGGNGIATVEVSAYTIPGIRNFDSDTTSIIDSLRGGIYSDTSIGFSGGKWICAICGNDMMRSWDCYHLLGWDYEVKNEMTGAIGIVRAVADIEDARLNEVSLVYDGATPNAMVLKAESLAESGQLNDDQRRYITTRCKRELPDKRLVVPGHSLATVAVETPLDRMQEKSAEEAADVNASENANQSLAEPTHRAATSEEPMSNKVDTKETPTPAATTVVEDRSAETLGKLLGDAQQESATLRAENKRVNDLFKEQNELIAARDAEVQALKRDLETATARVAELDSYRNDMIEVAIKNGTAADAINDANEATWRSIMARNTIAEIRIMTETWDAQAQARFAGGRKTSDESKDPTRKDVTPVTRTQDPSLFRV